MIFFSFSEHSNSVGSLVFSKSFSKHVLDFLSTLSPCPPGDCLFKARRLLQSANGSFIPMKPFISWHITCCFIGHILSCYLSIFKYLWLAPFFSQRMLSCTPRLFCCYHLPHSMVCFSVTFGLYKFGTFTKNICPSILPFKTSSPHAMLSFHLAKSSMAKGLVFEFICFLVP